MPLVQISMIVFFFILKDKVLPSSKSISHKSVRSTYKFFIESILCCFLIYSILFVSLLPPTTNHIITNMLLNILIFMLSTFLLTHVLSSIYFIPSSTYCISTLLPSAFPILVLIFLFFIFYAL